MADRTQNYQADLDSIGKEYGLDPLELRAIMQQESRGNPNAVSSAGAKGLMQINTRVHPMADPFDPVANIRKGAEVLRDSYDYMRKHGIPEEDLQAAAWAGYNRGPAAVVRDYRAGLPVGHGTDDQEGTDYPTGVQARLDTLRGGDSAQGQARSPRPLARPARQGGHPEGEAQQQYITLADGRVPLRDDEEGEVYYAKPDYVAAAVARHGLRPMGGDEYDTYSHQKAIHEKYGTGVWEGVKTAAEGAAAGLVPGAEGIIAKTGLETPEAIKEHRESYPVTHALSETGALIGGALVGDEAGVANAAEKGVVKAGEEILPKAFAEVAKKAEGEVAPTFARALPETGTVAAKTEEAAPTFTRALPASEPHLALPPRSEPDFTVDAFGNAQRGGLGETKALPPRSARFEAGPGGEVRDWNDPAQQPLDPAKLEALVAQSAREQKARIPKRTKDWPAWIDRDLPSPVEEEQILASEAAPSPRISPPPFHPKASALEAPPDLPRSFRFLAGPEGEVRDFGPTSESALAPEGAPDLPRSFRFQAGPEGGVRDFGSLPEAPHPQPDFTVDALGNAQRGGGSTALTLRQESLPSVPEASSTDLARLEVPQTPEVPPAGPGPVPEGLLRQAARLASGPNRAIWGMGGRVGSAVEEALGGGIGAKIAGRYARGAAETLPYAVGQNYSDAVLNNEPITIERLAAGVAPQMLLGGALGGALGAAELGLNRLKLEVPHLGHPLAPKDIGEVARNGAESLQSVVDHVEASVRAAYAPTEDGIIPKYARVEQILGDRAGVAVKGKDALWSHAAQVADSLPNTAAANQYREAVGDLAQKLGNAKTDAQVFRATDEFKRTLDKGIQWDRVGHGVPNPVKDAIVEVRRATKTLLEKEDVFGDAAKFQSELNDRVAKVIKLASPKLDGGVAKRFMEYGVLEGEPDRVFSAVKFGKYLKNLNHADPLKREGAARAENVLKEWMGANRDLVGFLRNEIHEPLGNPHALERLHDSLGAHDAVFAQSIKDAAFLSDSQKKTLLQRLVHDRGARLGASLALMTSGVPHAFFLTWGTATVLEKALNQGKGAFAAAISEHSARYAAAIKDGVAAAIRGAGRIGPMSVGVLKGMHFGGEGAPAAGNRYAQIAQIADQLAQSVADPDKAMARVAASTKLLQSIDPEMAMQVQAQALRSVQYLHDQAPRDPLPPSPYGSPPYQPGHADVARFEQVAEVVSDPLVLVRDLANGTLGSDQVATAEAVYPEILGHIRDEVTSALAEHRAAGEEPIPYRKQLAIERLMGQPAGWASQPDAVALLQQSASAAAKAGQGNPSAGGASNKPRQSTSAKASGLLADHVQSGLQSALSRV